ncbi:MAG: acyl carrier protein [Blautia sp.]|nr:acyl carrier protein [Blautia sp.]
MREKIEKIFAEALPQIDITASDALVDDGYLDSISLITLISELSMEFGVEFVMEDYLPENFNSIDAIVETVKRLQE